MKWPSGKAAKWIPWWGAVRVGAAGLLVQQPANVAKNSVTPATALGYTFETAGGDALWRFLRLQAMAFVTLCRIIPTPTGPAILQRITLSRCRIRHPPVG